MSIFFAHPLFFFVCVRLCVGRVGGGEGTGDFPLLILPCACVFDWCVWGKVPLLMGALRVRA